MEQARIRKVALDIMCAVAEDAVDEADVEGVTIRVNGEPLSGAETSQVLTAIREEIAVMRATHGLIVPEEKDVWDSWLTWKEGDPS